MKPTLLIMAAGMGSRFGGLKQMQGVGPGGETLLDYSIFDALRAGFGKVVFIVRREMEADFRERIGKHWESKVSVSYAFQELSDLPSGFQAPPARQKPWGTGHAIYSARQAVHEPFAVLNADDYYGPHTFQVMGDFLKNIREIQSIHYAMVGYKLANTLSEFGTVSRGLCEADPEGDLKKIVERLKVRKTASGAEYLDETGRAHALKGDELVSMNIWGCTPAIFPQLENLLRNFLSQHGDVEKSEFLIPKAIDLLIHQKQVVVKILPTRDSWFGLTYPEDREQAKVSISRLISERVYPENLWR
jgi:UTP-glucose-1-phosphate uridylyltransferase